MAKKQLSSELDAVFGTINQKQGSKAHPTVSKEEAEQRRATAQTQGAKGAKMDRINMAFTPDNFQYIRIMSKIRGESMTTFCNYIIEQHRTEHPEQFEQARAIIEQMG